MADKLYTPNTWTDEVLASDALYNILQSDDTPIHEEVKIELDTEVGTAGTAVNAERMNNIEDGIDALDDLLVEMQSKIKLDAAAELTISGGSITITQSIHKLQPESGTEDDLDTIAGIAAGDLVILYCSDPGTDTITIKHGTGNISCMGEDDLELSEGGVLLYSDGTTVYAIGGGGGGAVASGNLLLNGGFDFFQRGGVSSAVNMSDDAYNAPDCWYSLIQGANATIQRLAGGVTSPNSAKLVAGGATNRFGIAQIVNQYDSIPKRGKTEILQFYVKPVLNAGSGTMDVRIALLEWTGTADSVTSEIVQDWTSADYTVGASKFFADTTLTLVGTAKISAAHNAWTQISVSGEISASCNNLIAFIWTEDAPAHASDYLLICEAGLYDGETVQAWNPRLRQQELALCQMFYEKSYGLDVVPGTSDAAKIRAFCAASTTTAAGDITIYFGVRKYGTPTVNFWKQDGTANEWQAYQYSPPVSTGGAVTNAATTPGFVTVNVAGTGLTAGAGVAISGHYTAKVEL